MPLVWLGLQVRITCPSLLVEMGVLLISYLGWSKTIISAPKYLEL
jgi:hypothetical protein